MALATSAPKPNVVHTLAELDLADEFPSSFAATRCRGKPAPDVFIEAARRLGVAPADCLVFEDAPMGIEAAQAAGMRVVALTTSFQASHFEHLNPPPTSSSAISNDYLSFS